jgi:PAS domain S-box-containing protein
MEYVSSQVAIAIERKRSEIQIKEEKDRAKLYLDIAVVMLIALDRNGKIILVNKMTLELLKYEENELLGKNWFEVCVSSKERDTVENRFHQIMKGKRKPSTEFENTVLTSKGRSRTIVWNTEVLRDEKGEINGLLSSGKDITQKLRNEKKNKELSAQLIQSQKLESIGTLASGVAHEINNPLTVIINYAEMMMAYENLDEKLNKWVKEIIKEGYRVAQIVKSLLAFSKAEVGFFSRTTLKSIVDSSISLVDSVLFSEQILCTIDIAENLEEIQCQGQQIQQVIMNLITNARYELNQKFPSWDDNKRIHIIVRPFKRKNVKWQRLTIEDFGPGISEETQKRIFEPFYSTKPADSGTGLGLAVSYGIIREHNGKLWVESEIGKYTRFHVELPVDNEDLEY